MKPHVDPFVAPSPSPVSQTKVPSADGAIVRIDFVNEPARVPFALSAQDIAVGREPGCDISFDAAATVVSRVHAHIRLEGGDFIVEDNNSFNGTFLNGQRISAPTPLYHNDEICLGTGGPVLRFYSPSRVAPVGASLAGQRSLHAENAALRFESVEEAGHFIDNVPLEEEVRQAICSETAARVLKLPRG